MTLTKNYEAKYGLINCLQQGSLLMFKTKIRMNTKSFFRLSLSLVVLVMSISLSSVQSQTFSAMLVGGFNLSQVDGDKLGGFNKIGFNTGARVSAQLSERFHLSTEFLFSQQGASRVPTDDISSPYDKIRLNFVEVPVMINYSDWKILASAGVSYNRLINYEVISDNGEDITELEIYREDIPALVLGATYKFSEKMALNIRWSRYLRSLLPSDDDPNTEDVNFIGRTIGIRLYYYL